MATLGGFADLSRYQQAAAQPLASPLDSLIQGFQQGQAIRNLPQTLAENALNKQLEQAILQAKLQQLQNPQAEIINASGSLFVRDPSSPTGIRNIFTPDRVSAQPRISEQLGVQFVTDQNGQIVARPIPMEAPSLLQTADPLISPNATALQGRLAQQEAARLQRDASSAQTKQEDKASERAFRTGERESNQEFLKGMAQRKEEAKAAPASSQYQEEASARNLQSITDLKTRVGPYTTGPGSLLSKIPGTSATDFAADLDTLKANIAFGELAAMRAASKTGGALGNVSNKEMKLLESSLGALDTSQSPTNFLKNLNNIEASVNRWKEAAAKTENKQSTSNVTRMIAPDGSAFDIPTSNVNEALKRGARLP